MEPPAKRLRILRSVEVDETNPDYIAAKQKQQEKFKGRLERLFAKYGDMHESMSDEIDFSTGKVVVDRGHLRRVQRQMKRKGPGLLDSLLEPELQREESPEEEEVQDGSEDELAPKQTRKRKRSSFDGKESAQSAERRSTAMVATLPQTAPTAIAQEIAFQTPRTPNPAANLFQQIQQTPLDQQAQATLLANLNQTIAQAVQQAVAPFLSILTPNGQASATLPSAPTPCLQATDSVRPAADPKWYFPPISAVTVEDTGIVEAHKSSPAVARKIRPQTTEHEISSPTVTRRRSPKVCVQTRRSIAKKRSPCTLEQSVERPQSSHSLPTLDLDNHKLEARLSIHDARNHTGRNTKSLRKYNFTEEDDIYISDGRNMHNMTFKMIRDSRAEWSEWPLSAFYNRWSNHLKNKKSHVQNAQGRALVPERVSTTPVDHEEHFFSSIEIPETSSAEHRLPTPSSLEQDDSHIEQTAIPPSSHFDDDELELLSLAGADISDVLPRHSFHYADDSYPTPDEPLPSIEGAEFRNEDELQDELQREMLKFEDSPTPAPTQLKALPSTIPETQESCAVVSTPTPTQKPASTTKPRPKPIPTYRAATDASDDLDLIGTNDEPPTPHVHIKRESLTPQATRILCSSPVPKTPRPALQSSGTAKSTGKLDRRAFNQEVKQAWAKARGKATGSQKRRSLNALPVVKSSRIDLGDSEDELAL